MNNLQMRQRRPDLIVPVKDRRARKRYLTLKNFGWFALVCAIAFAAITIRSEFRDPTDHGTLYERRVISEVEQRPVEVVEEATPIGDQAVADPMLVAPLARSEWLEGDQTATLMEVSPAMSVPRGELKGRIAIVGGPEGLTVVSEERRKPVLSGGFGRKP